MQPETTTHPNEPRTKSTISIPAAIISAAAIIAIALIVVFAPKTAKQNAQTPRASDEVTSVPADVATIRANDHVRGDSEIAQVAIIEYGDTDCYYCNKLHPVLKQLFTEYKGKLAWVYRHYPITSLHPNAATEAIALECVGNIGGDKAFNEYLDTVMNVTLNPDPKSNEALTTFATAQGVDSKMLKTCIAGTTASNRVKADTDEAVRIGAQGTPFSILVNLKTGKQIIVPGAYPYEEIKKDIDSLLK